MALTKSTIEHEFLFRWDEQGNPKGCHIAYREAILENGVEISSKFLDPRPVQLSDAEKLAEIGASINASVLADNAAKSQQLAEAKAAAEQQRLSHEQAIAQLGSQHDSVVSALASNHAEAIATLTAERASAVDGMQAILDTVTAERDAAVQDASSLRSQVGQLTAQAESSASQKTMLEGQIESLKAQLLEYETPVDEKGVPKAVSMHHAQLALLNAGLLDMVEEAIAAIPGDAGRAARITWSKATTVERNNPLVVQLSSALGLTSEQIDALFVFAATL